MPKSSLVGRAGYLSLPALLWVGLWFGINTGHWVLRQVPATPVVWAHFARTVFPFFAVGVAGSLLGNRRARTLWQMLGPAKLWFAYGVVSLLACVSSPYLFAAVYWSGVYLSVFPVLLLALNERDPLASIVRLNRFNLVVAALFLVVMLVLARDALFVGSGLETSAYGVSNRAAAVEGVPLSRSSGFARFAAVVGIVSLVYLWQARGGRKLCWALLLLLATAFLYTLQSRGAIVAYAVSLALLVGLRCLESRRMLLVPLVLLVGIALFADRIPFDRIRQHITRGEDAGQLATLGGRTSTWERARPVIYRSPVWGYGMQADRYLLAEYEHAHNTYLYALLTAGSVGTVAFAAGLGWAWLLLLGTAKRTILAGLPAHPFCYEAAGILAFFTVRSISEVSGALFGVDYMLMLPVIVYLYLSHRTCLRRIPAGVHRPRPHVRNARAASCTPTASSATSFVPAR